MKLIILIPILFLSGCGFLQPKVETKYIDRDIYVVRQAPADLYTLPQDATPIDVDTATQRDVSKWIAEKNRHTEQLEGKLKALKEFYDRPVQEDEKKKPDSK